MSKRSTTTVIDEKTFEDVEPKKQTEQRPQSNSSEAFEKTKTSMNEDTANTVTDAKTRKQASKEQTTKSISLFSSHNAEGLNPQIRSEIFSNLKPYSDHPNKQSLFSNSCTPFSIDLNKNQSLFNFSSWKGPAQTNTNNNKSLFSNNSDDEEGDSANLENQQFIETDPSKSTKKFDYPVNCKIILKKNVIKYKKESSDLIENLLLTILHDEGKGTYCIKVSIPATQNAIFVGLLSPGKSKIRKLNERDSFEILAFSLKKDKPKKLVSNRLKLTVDVEDSAQLMEKITQIIEGEPK